MNNANNDPLLEQYSKILENEDNRVWKNTECPEALGDSPLAGDIKPDEPCSTPDSECVTGGKAITPEDSKDNEYYLHKISERLKENVEKTGKIGEQQINNFETMSTKDNNPNIFDKLYSTLMEGDNPFDNLDSMEAEIGGEGEDLGGEELEIGGDEISFSLPKDVAQQLCDVLKGALGDGEEGDEIEDLDDGLGEEEGGLDDEMLGDAVVSKPEPSAASDGVPHLTGKNNKPSASGYAADGGSAEHGNIKEDPTPSELGGHGDRDHPDAGNVSSGSNKIHNPKSKGLGD